MDKSKWPSSNDYGDALQTPGRSLYNFPELREAEVEKNALKRPKGRSGNFAIVYKLTGTKGPIAAKLFKSPDADRQRRYDAVSVHLKKAVTGYTVGFHYHEHGIYVNSGYFPMLLMDWVEGEPLGQWYHKKAVAKDGNSLRALADEWVKLMGALRKAEIAHGDLQHGNVLVVGGRLKLVDYDGMYVPALRDAPQIERGVDDYQHPERAAQTLGPDLDHFSAWIILISLRALAADPSLYAKYKHRTGDAEPHENLLFVKRDLVPESAKAVGQGKNADIWRDLRKSPDAEVRDWAINLWECLDKQFERIPPFELDPFRTLRTACATRPADWEQIARLANGMVSRKPPAELAEIIETARKRVACRDRLKEALAKGDQKAICNAYAPELLDDWPACKSLVQQAKSAGKRVIVLQELEAAARTIGDGRAFVKKWESLAADLAGVMPAKRFQDLAEQWRLRIAVAEAFLALLKPPMGDERTLASAWKKIEKYAPPHPDLTAEHQERGKLAGRRVSLLERFAGLPKQEDEATDRQLDSLWDQGLIGGCPEAGTLSKRIESARARLKALRELRERIAVADKDGDEEAVVLTAKKLPADYLDEAVRQRVALARERLLLGGELKKAIESDSDRAIKAAWDKARKQLGEQRATEWAERCELALKRCELLAKLEAIPPSAALDAQDGKWERLWKDDLLGACADAKPLRPRYEEAVRRLQARRALERSLRRGEPGKVRTRAADPLLAGYPPVKKQQALIDEFIRKADDVDRILTKLNSAKSGLQLGEDDLQVLRNSPQLFPAEVRARIEEFVAQRLRTSLRLAPIDEGYELGPSGAHVVLRWTWPDFALISSCYVALGDTEAPRSPGETPMTCSFADHRRAGGGMRIFADAGSYASIWPVVNLGWKNLVGEPLAIGPIGANGTNGSAGSPQRKQGSLL